VRGWGGPAAADHSGAGYMTGCAVDAELGLIGAHVPSLVRLVPRIDGSPILPVAGFVLADLILVALVLWDWRANERTDVFPAALGVMLAYHASVLTLYRVPAWHAFCAWFLGLPLS